jgi:nitrate/nitrite-specific signal transduction histidine kinase
VSILLTQKDRSVAAVVEVDGRGFDDTASPEDALGLVGMREGMRGPRRPPDASVP